jgi:hypothetical protein
VNVNPAVEPAVIAVAVKSTVAVPQTGAGFVIATVGAAVIVTVPIADADPQLVIVFVIITL